MRGLLWLLVALNALVFLAGASGALQDLTRRAIPAPHAVEGSAAPLPGPAASLTLLSEAKPPAPAGAGDVPVRAQAAARAGTPGSRPPQQGVPPDAQEPAHDAAGSPPDPAFAAAAAPDVPPQPAPAVAPRLRSGSAAQPREAGEDPGAPREDPQPAAVAPVDAACFEVGPIPEEGGAADAAAQAVAARGGEILGREQRGSGPVRHWVLIEGFADRAAAERERERILAAGFTDVLPVERASGWALSLGLFGQRSRAQAHRQTLRAAGFAAELAQHRGGAQATWLRVSLPADQRDALATALPARARLAPCAGAGIAGAP